MDRLVAEWWLHSKRVTTLLATGQKPELQVMQRISVPAQIYAWKAAAETRSRAADVQGRNRELFLKAFADRLSVLGYERNSEGDGTFLLGRWDEQWSYASEDKH